MIEAKANETIDQMAARGIQPVGVAQYDDQNQRRLPLYDPLREECISTVATASPMV